MPTAVKFSINQVHDGADRRRVNARKNELMAKFAKALGGFHALDSDDRTNIEIAAELVALCERAKSIIERASVQTEAPDGRLVRLDSHHAHHGDPAALKRLEEFAAKAVDKLGLPPDFSETAPAHPQKETPILGSAGMPNPFAKIEVTP